MKKSHIVLAGAVVANLAVGGAGLAGGAGPAFSIPRTETEIYHDVEVVKGEVLARFRTATAAAQGDSDQAMIQRRIREAAGPRARHKRSELIAGLYIVTIDPSLDLTMALARFRAMPEVEYAEPNCVARAFDVPNDPLYGPLQWHLRMIGMERGWDIQKGDPSVVIAVLDSGIAFENVTYPPNLLGIPLAFGSAPDWASGTFVAGFDPRFGLGQRANDVHGHGTHVASTIAEATDNGLGVAGMAYRCRLMPVRVLGFDFMGSFEVIASGVRFAATNGAKVINMSLGAPAEAEQFGQTLRREVDQAIAAGVVVVAASGNEADPINPGVGFPARIPDVIAVGAVDAGRRRARYSNFGPQLDVVAPGGDYESDGDGDRIPDAVWQQTYFGTGLLGLQVINDLTLLNRFAVEGYQGTSMATPHVAALAALLVSQGVTDPAAVRAAITSTATDLGPAGRDDEFGHGLIDPVKVLTGLGLNR